MYKIVRGKEEIGAFVIRDSAYWAAKDASRSGAPVSVLTPGGAVLVAKNGRLYESKECVVCDNDGEIRNPNFVSGGPEKYFIPCDRCGGSKRHALSEVP